MLEDACVGETGLLDGGAKDDAGDAVEAGEEMMLESAAGIEAVMVSVVGTGVTESEAIDCITELCGAEAIVVGAEG